MTLATAEVPDGWERSHCRHCGREMLYKPAHDAERKLYGAPCCSVECAAKVASPEARTSR